MLTSHSFSEMLNGGLNILDVGKGTVNGVNLSCCSGTSVDWKDWAFPV